MLLASDVHATFHPSTFQSSASLGIGQLNICGIVINFTVYPSQYGQGILVSFPSRPVMKDGVHVVENGKKKYNNEVYIAERAIQPIIDNAVLQAMQNKGITVNAPSAQPQSNNQSARDFGQRSPSPAPTPTIGNPHSSSVVSGDDLPF